MERCIQGPGWFFTAAQRWFGGEGDSPRFSAWFLEETAQAQRLPPVPLQPLGDSVADSSCAGQIEISAVAIPSIGSKPIYRW